MYNPYVTSTLSIRCKSPFPYSFNDCSYIQSDYRTNTNLISSSQSCCCACCSTSYVYRNPTNPRYLCGSRQSSLIQWSASRKFWILPEPDPYCCQVPVFDPCRKCCCGYVRERGSGERKFGRRVAEGRSCDFETAEMMLSLLIEDVGEECYSVRERDCSSLRRVEFNKKGSDSDRFCRKEREKRENGNSGLLGSSLRSKYEALRIESRENEAKSRQNESRKSEDEEVFRSEKLRGRKSGSSCSSYYTCSSLAEDSESDSEIDVGKEAYKEETGEGCKRDSIKRGNVVYEGEIKENLRRDESTVGSHKTIESDWRKKSEKKLDEVAIGEVCESSHNRASNTHKQFDTVDEKSNFLISESGTRQQYGRRSDQNIGGSESTRKQKQFLETCEDDVEAVSRNRFNGREEKSTVTGSLILGKKQEHVKKDDRVSLRDDYRLSTEQSNQVSQLDDINVKRTNISQSQYEGKVKRLEDRYSVVSSSIEDTEKRYHLKSEEDSRKMDSRRKFQQSTEISDDRVSRRDDYRSSTEQSIQDSQIQDMNVRRTNISKAQYEDKVKRRENQSSLVSSSVQDTINQYYLQSEEDLRQKDLRGKFRQSAEISDDRVSRRDDYRSSTEQSNELSQIQDTNVRRTNISSDQYEDKVKRQERKSSMISSSVQDTENQYYLQREEELREMDTRRKSQQSTKVSDGRVSQRDDYRLSTEHLDQISQIQDTNVKKSNISHARYEDKVKRREHLSSVVSSSVQDTKSQYYLQREEDLRQMDSRRKLQQMSETSAAQAQYVQSNQQVNEKESTKGSLDMSTITLGQSSDTQVTNIHKSSENKISREETYSSVVVKSTEETKKRTETSDNRVLRFGSINETGGTSRKASSLQETFVLETPPNLDNESNPPAIVIAPQSRIPSTSSQSGFDNDPLGSAHRFHKSSSKIVGEFLGNFTHEASTSQQQIEKSNSEEEMLVEGHKHEEKSLSEYVDVDSTSQQQVEKSNSEEEMLVEGYKHEEKSLSEYVDVDLKLKGQESRRSSGSPGVKGPSDEIWDEVAPSTRESERTIPSQSIVVKRTGRSLWNVISDIVKLPWSSRSKLSTPKSGLKNSPDQSTRSEAWFSSHDQDETSDENMKRRNKGMSHESVPTPIQSQGEGYSSSSSKDKISPGKTPIGSTTPKGSSSASTEENFKVENPVSMPSLRIRRSPNVDDVAEVDKRTRGKEQVTDSSPSNVKGYEGKVGGDMKRRMLQRTNQVIKDRFDEWEEAFTLETEQRKIDEAFMREALLEAKKAGDMWEVPVGAVLVQDGKIIARGYNLVEELRDSTAHAEMICIREGSNQLRTWRLADTTLYVTLEPCPMCAGAILQARVDTVVWGAPNKLLGADGSWIRLFPGGGEGETSSESTEKPRAPVHPFHPKIVIRRGVLGTECADVMQQFFQLRRRKKDKKQLPDTPPAPPACLPITNHPAKILNRMEEAFHFMFCL